MPLSGGAPTPLALGSPGSSIVVDATMLYYFDEPNGRLLTLPLDGSTPKVLGSGYIIWGSTIAVDSTSVYWGRMESNFKDSSIIKVPLNGGPETVLAARLQTDAAIAVAVDATSAYFTVHSGNEAVMKVSLAGSAPKILTQGVPVGYGLAVDATSVYWTGGDAVMKVPLDGGTPTTLASGQRNPNALAVDGTNVYWTTMGSEPDYHATVMKVPLAGGTPTTIATGERGLWGLAIDANNVYWVDPLTDTVKSAPK
jgi:hypothetical protein